MIECMFIIAVPACMAASRRGGGGSLEAGVCYVFLISSSEI